MNEDERRLRFRPLLEAPTVEIMEPESAIDPTKDAKAFLEAIISSVDQPTSRKVRAAIALLPFQYPKHSTITHSINKDFAKNLEQARKIRDGGLSLVIADRGEANGD